MVSMAILKLILVHNVRQEKADKRYITSVCGSRFMSAE